MLERVGSNGSYVSTRFPKRRSIVFERRCLAGEQLTFLLLSVYVKSWDLFSNMRRIFEIPEFEFRRNYTF